MTIIGGKNSRGYGGQRYVCATYREHGSEACSNSIGVSRGIVEKLLINPLREKLLSDASFATALRELVSAGRKFTAQNSCQNSASLTPLVAANAFRGRGSAEAADESLLAITRSDDATALAARRVAAIESAVAAGAMSQRDGQTHIARIRAEAQRVVIDVAPSDESSFVTNVECLRAALQSAATAVLRDALRRVLGTVRCVPEDGALVTYFNGGNDAVLTWLGALGTKIEPGRNALVAGVGFSLT
jgi:hypothetical protein